MALAWYVCPYKRLTPLQPPTRYCAMDDFSAQIQATGGGWSETEVLGDCAVCKVRATPALLTTIAAATGFQRLPKARLHDTLSDLTAAQRVAIRDRLNQMGYPLQEIADALGDLSQRTLGDALRFACRRRLQPRYDAGTDAIVCDGPIQPVRPLSEVDGDVT